MMWYTRFSKLGAASVFKNYTNQQNLLKQQKHSFSNHLGGYKSAAPLIISSKYGQYHPNNLYKVKHNCNTYGGQAWRRSISSDAPTKTCISQQIILSWVYKCIAGCLGFTFVVLPVGVGLYRTCETIPYTYRTHFVLLPPRADKLEPHFKDYFGLLPEEHPDSVRVKSIGEQIVKALESDLEAIKGKSWKKPSVDHLVGMNWEFLVVNDSRIDGFGLPGGKILVSTGLLKRLESEADIATIIGHEVGHIVARHGPGRLNKDWLAILLANKYFLGLAISIPKMAEHIPDGVSELGRVLFTYPRLRREEMEADYIGLLLMASAGFDPQEAPKVYLIFEASSQTHPSGKKRAEYLAKAKVMEQAKSIYSKTIESRKMNDIKDG